MSEEGDVDVESAEDVPDIGVEATATTMGGTANGSLYRGGSNDKRAHHNALERRRRDHIKDSFHGLRDCIPSLVGEKVSRAHILNKATEYIRHMQKGGSTREDDICDLARKNEILEEQVRALDEAQVCGGQFNVEELLQTVASRVQARQVQEMAIQQMQAKSSSKSAKQSSKTTSSSAKGTASPSNAAVTPSSAAALDKSKVANNAITKSTEATPTSGSSQVTLPMNLLASNLKSTQSLLSVLQKNLSPNSNLTPSIKSLARVLASPLVRGAQQKTTTQASSLPRGIVTATTVPKGSNLPPATTPLNSTSTTSTTSSSSSSSTTSKSATGIANAQTAAESVQQLESSLPIEVVPISDKGTPNNISSSNDDSASPAASPVAAPNMPLPLSGGAEAAAGGGGGGTSPSSLASQLLETHNLLQQQGAANPPLNLNSAESAATAVSLDMQQQQQQSLAAVSSGLSLSPELLAQVSSLLNLPLSNATANSAMSANSLGAGLDGTHSLSQDLSNLAQATLTSDPAPLPNNSSSSIRKRSSSSDPTPPPLAKKPHIEEEQ